MFLLLMATPAQADLVELKEGDLFCVGYDKKSDSCASIITLKDLGDGKYVSVELGGFEFGDTRLDMAATMTGTVNDGQFCADPDGVKISISPKESKLAEGWQNLMQYQFDEMLVEGYCVEHRSCGEEWLAVAFVGGKERRELSAVFRVFDADDPRTQSVQPRYLNQAEMAKMTKQSERCLPEDA